MTVLNNCVRVSRKCCSLTRQNIYGGHGLRALVPPLPMYLPSLHWVAMRTYLGSHKRDENNTYRSHAIHPTSVLMREYHVTCSNDRAAAIFLTLGAAAATARAGQYAVQGYIEWKASMNAKQKHDGKNRSVEEDPASKPRDAPSANLDDAALGSNSSAGKAGKRENIFANFFNVSVGSKYYEGGFEEKMTRKEAALILGVRESTAIKRIKEAHRKLLILNHPDTGGSTFMAGKINEAKELLLKGKKR
mmetsp:Transcript_16220/g.35054  ORF Transcript_16220/g.35054 Transcript_16220/m.35054 type:complete len:247 (+) Transcript_16220:59-799(+)|eukprot:CAMPEP_0172298086 /NCGR_PEP_ID=MMETSP1058-20130122/891_1 /TAXON_ID=83371 /ORGANISM="Detonula confervacea, Strain CCMP 353" /LENGTH=246 /DNA_ID=CAMNT_0013007325 /DNA_START=24 /DNA_END=764 /DNA_ORIENTATION=+